jgi:hypothetical protein
MRLDRSTWRPQGWFVAAAALGLGLSASLLAACSSSIPGGFGGVILTLFVSSLVFGLHKIGCASSTAEAGTKDGAEDGARDATTEPCLSQACLCMCELPLPAAAPGLSADDPALPRVEPFEVQRARARTRLGPRLPPDVQIRLGRGQRRS